MKLEKRSCLCDNPFCAKCLGVNCEDDNCLIHSIKNKIGFKMIIVNNLKDKNKIMELKKRD